VQEYLLIQKSAVLCVSAQKVNGRSYGPAWHSSAEFCFDDAFLSVKAHNLSYELVVSFHPNHFSPDELSSFGNRINV
jgi:hypothetical protein